MPIGVGPYPWPVLPDSHWEALYRANADRQRFEREQLGEDYGACGLVFATLIGTPVSNSLALTYYRRALGCAGPPAKIRIHDLRRAAASTMLGNGLAVPTVAKVLGHARNSTTLDVYGHAIPTNLTIAVATLERAFAAV
jgi:integrase